MTNLNVSLRSESCKQRSENYKGKAVPVTDIEGP
jgi:hypothetical protein